MKLTKRMVVTPVAESIYGADPGSGYTGLLLREGGQIQVNGETITRDTLRSTMSPSGHVVGRKEQVLTLPFELRGAGETGGTLNVPELDGLLKACSMAREDGSVIVMSGVTGTFARGETVTNDTQANTLGTVADIDGTTLYIRAQSNAPVAADAITGDTSAAAATVASFDESYVYRPLTSDAPGSAAIPYYMDGIKHLVLGARGTFTVDMSVGAIPGISFTMTGLYANPSDSTNPTPSYLSLVPRPVVGANLTIGALDTSLVTVNALTMDLANDVQPYDDIQAATGRKQFLIVGRDPTGSIDPEVTALSAFNPYTDWAAGNSVAIAAGIGAADGERIRVVMPATQYTELPYGERNGIATYGLGFRATGDDDEFMLIYS